MFTKGQQLSIPLLGDELRHSEHRFRVIDVIRGGMDVCARIKHEATDKEFAVKGLGPTALVRNEAWARYLWEMKTWVTLSSFSGVVQAYCLAELNDVPFVCAAWMKGGNLRPHLSKRTPTFLFSALLRILYTLEFAQDRYDIIHRDLKPENILLDGQGLAYVADWGLARAVNVNSETETRDQVTAVVASDEFRLTAEGSFLGTIVYASPEQILGIQAIDHRSDIYSVGCILYEWESGAPPFLGRTAEEIAVKHLREKPRSLSRLFRRTAFGLEEIIYRCLSKDPRDRYQDYKSLIHAVSDVARARRVEMSFTPSQQRYAMHFVGKGGFAKALEENHIAGEASGDKSLKVVEGRDLEPFLREADALLLLGEWEKAIEILERIYVPDFARLHPDLPFQQAVAVSYALCLIKLGQAPAAIEVLDSISKAREKRAEYYVNLSLAFLSASKPRAAETVAREGLRFFDEDTDLLGNLSISLADQGLFSEAIRAAETRLRQRRDLRTLQDAGQILIQIGNRIENIDWPEAVTNYRLAIALLEEAKRLNPRHAPVHFKIAEALFKIELFPVCLLQLQGMADIPRHRSVIVASLELWARCFDKVAMHKECVDFCDKMLKKYPSETRIHRIRAETIFDGFCVGQERNGQRVLDKSSYEFFARVLKSPAERWASDYSYYARLLDWMGRKKDAIEICANARSRYPANFEFALNLARSYAESGDPRSALPFAVEATQLAPRLSQTWGILEWIYAELKDSAETERARKKVEQVKTERGWLNQAVKAEFGSRGPG